MHYIFGLDWAGSDSIFSCFATSLHQGDIHQLPRSIQQEKRCLCVFFHPRGTLLSNTVAEQRAKGLSMDALTPPTKAHNANSPQWLFATLSLSPTAALALKSELMCSDLQMWERRGS